MTPEEDQGVTAHVLRSRKNVRVRKVSGATVDPAASSDGKTSRWTVSVEGRDHRVEVIGSVSRTSSWYVDDALVGSKKTSDNNVVLEDADTPGWAVGVKFDGLGRAKRVTLYEGDAETSAKLHAVLGTGGIDFDPEPGTRAALRQQRIREHPRRHAAILVAGGIAKVVLPLLLALLAVRIVIALPWPNWNIPWPDIDLPRIPWPDIPWPDIPWPNINLPDWQLPAWLSWVLDHVKYVWPILLAGVLAGGEIRRQRRQDALKAELAKQRDAAPAPAPADTDDQKRPPADPAGPGSPG